MKAQATAAKDRIDYEHSKAALQTDTLDALTEATSDVDGPLSSITFSSVQLGSPFSRPSVDPVTGDPVTTEWTAGFNHVEGDMLITPTRDRIGTDVSS